MVINLLALSQKLRHVNFRNAGKQTPIANIPPIRYKPLDLPEPDRNHVIGVSDVLAEGGAISKLNANMEAILLLRQLESENRNPTIGEKKVLQKFVGWGGIAEVFKPVLSEGYKGFVEKMLSGKEESAYGKALPTYSMVGKTFAEIVDYVRNLFKVVLNVEFDLATVRHYVVRYLLMTFDNLAYQDAINSTINAHYTSRTVIIEMWKLLEKVGFQGGNILESSAGVGHFFGLMPSEIAKRSALYGVEKDIVSGLIAKRLYPQADIQISGFESADLPLGIFDVVIGNVPFGKSDLVQDSIFREIARFNLHNYFIAKSLIALRPGGLCFVITSHSTMDNGDVPENEKESTRVNSYDFRKWADSADKGNADFLGAIRLPNNAFLDNANTEVVTDIVLLRKRDSPSPHELAQSWLALEKVGEGNYLIGGEEKALVESGKKKITDFPDKVAIKVNQYYAENPFMMIGTPKLQHESNAGRMYNDANRQTVELDNPKDFPAFLPKTFATLAEYLGKVYAHNPDLATLTNTGVALGQLGEYVVLPDNKAYMIAQGEEGNNLWTKYYVPLENIKGKDIEMLKAYTSVKTVLKKLLIVEQGESEESGATATKRKELNQSYADFVKKFGYINKYKRLLKDEADWYLLSNLEVFKPKNGTYDQAPIFNTKVAFGYPIPETAEHIEDAYEISINYRGTLDTSYMASLLKISEDEVIDKLLTTEIESFVGTKKIIRPLAFLNPTTGLIEDADRYLSGNVRQKLVEAKEFAEKDSRYAINLRYLEGNQADWLSIDKIVFGIQSTWIPATYIESFAREILKTPVRIEKILGYAKINVRIAYEGKFKPTDSFENKKYGLVVEQRVSEYDIFVNGMATTQKVAQNDIKYYAIDLIEALIVNSRPTIRRKKLNDNGVPIVKKDKQGNNINIMEVDEAMTNELQTQMFRLNTMFRQYITNNKERIAQLEKIYNDTYNESIERVWRVPKLDFFPGASRKIKLSNHQKAGVKRALQESMGGFWGVGTGKTYAIITTAMEMRRLGIAKKPLIVVQNATLEQFIADARGLYPTAKILAPTINEMQSIKEGDNDAVKLQKVQMARQERVALFAQIRFGDWDMIILPQSQFDLIPDSPARMRQLLFEKLAELEEQMYWLDDEKDKGLKMRYKGRIKDIESQIEEQNTRIEEEKHLKKLEDTKQKGVKVKDSARTALRIEAKLNKQLDRKTDKTLFFEQLAIDALLIDEAHAYKRLGFETNLTDVKGIDTAFSKRSMSTYLKIQWVYEMLKAERNVSLWTGTPISNTMAEMWTMTRFLRPSLLKDKMIQSFDSFANTFATVENSFEMDAGGRYKTVSRLTNFDNMPELMKIWKSYASVIIGEDVLGKAKSMTEQEYIELHKHNYQNQTPLLAMQENGERGYTSIVIEKSPAQRRQVLAFQQVLNWFDTVTGVCKKSNAHIPLVVFGRAKQATIDQRLLPDYINMKDVDCSPSPPAGRMHNDFDEHNKLFACAQNVFKIYQRDKANPTAQLVFCDTFRRIVLDFDNLDSKGEPKEKEVFNVYKELKRILVESGVPEHEIAIITDYDKNRLPLFTKVKNAEIRILIGSTQKMGIGVNVQDRLVALHHIDAPTRPMDFEQRNGRIIRQGNRNAVVEIFTYGIVGTLDAVAYSRLRQKQIFINQMMKGDFQERSMQDAFDDEGDADFYAQLSSMLTGSTTAVDFMKAKKDLQITKGKVEFEQQEAGKRVVEVGKAQTLLAHYLAEEKRIASFAQAIKQQFENVKDFEIQTMDYGNGLAWNKDTTKTIHTEKKDKEGKVTQAEKQEKVKLSEALASLLAEYEPQVVAHFREKVLIASQEHDYKGALRELLLSAKQENININGFMFLLNFRLEAKNSFSMQKHAYTFVEKYAGNNSEFIIKLSWNVIHENELYLSKSYEAHYALELSKEGVASEWQGDIHSTFRDTNKKWTQMQEDIQKQQETIAYLQEQIANPADLKTLMESITTLSNSVVALERKLKLEQEKDMREALKKEGLSGIIRHNAEFVRLGSLDMAIVERKEGAINLQALTQKLKELHFKKGLSGTKKTLFPTFAGELDIIE